MNYINLSQRVWQNPIYFIAFGFGSGLLPMAPGTWGTVAAIPVFLLMSFLPWYLYISLVILFFALGVWVSEVVSRDLGVPDYKGIVWDEVVGYLLTMFMAPAGWVWLLVGFVLFRIFDVWKPQPIKYIDQHVGGGLGIMLDDVLAAVPAWLILQCLVWSFWE